RSATDVPTDWLAPSARPIAAEIPIAGAPRTTIFLIASATSSYERSIRYFSSLGSRRWSSIETPSLVHSTVLITVREYYLTRLLLAKPTFLTTRPARDNFRTQLQRTVVLSSFQKHLGASRERGE